MPIYSSLVIDADISDSHGRLARGSLEFQTDGQCKKLIDDEFGTIIVIVSLETPYREFIPEVDIRENDLDALAEYSQVGVTNMLGHQKKNLVVSHQQDLPSSPLGTRHFSSMCSTSRNNTVQDRVKFRGSMLAELFSVYVGRTDREVSAICGKISVRYPYKPAWNLFESDLDTPELFPQGEGFVTIKGDDPVNCIFELEIVLYLIDPISTKELCSKTIAYAYIPIMQSKTEVPPDKRLCSFVKLGSNGYVLLHYIIFERACQATVEIKFFSDHPSSLPVKIFGSVMASYSNHNYSTVYEKKYYRSRLFYKPQTEFVRINPSIVEELERSLIGVSEDSRSVEVLSQILTNQWSSISKVRDLGPYKFIVTFVEKEDMEHVLQMENSPLLQYFSHICPWDFYQQGDIRRVWLEVMGIPPQVCSRDTCAEIASNFGVLVCCDSNFENPDSFVTCRMMIDTTIMSYIAEVLYLSIDEQCIGKAIYVREGSNQVTYHFEQTEPNRRMSWHQWDDTVSDKNYGQVGLFGSEQGRNEEELDMVGETQVENEESNGTGRSVTLVGNVHYDINEENDLISRKRSLKASLENSITNPNSDDDYPPGFQKLLNTKKFKRKPKSTVNLKRSNGNPKWKQTKKSKGLGLREEFEGISQVDSIENWSEDDFDVDTNTEEVKSRELGRLLGLGVGEALSMDELLK